MLRRMNGSMMMMAVVGAAVALSAACGGKTTTTTAGHGGSGGQPGTGAQVATGGSSSACQTDADCAAQVPLTSPPGCATGKCDTVQGACTFAAKDQDGDGHPAASCASTNGVPIQTGDDCDDSDPNLYPGHSEACSTLGDGGTITWPTGAPTGVCQYGHLSCEPDGTVSPCNGAVAPGPRDCNSSQDNDCNGTADNVDCVCMPGATRCSGNSMETCVADGSGWGAPVACVDQTCSSKTGACGGICASGAPNCAGQQPQTCNASGQWQDSGPACMDSSCVNGQCQICLFGQTQCNGQQPQSCDSAGNWQDNGPACSHQWCSGGSCEGLCGPGDTNGCGDCGTATCANGAWGSCENQGVCANGDTRVCVPSYPYGCTGQQTCSNTCGWGACGQTCSPFPPNTSMPGVVNNSAVFVPEQSGPNCLGSTNNYGPWQVCPTGSHIATIGCVMVSTPQDGTCKVIDQSATAAGISVHANNNCVNSARAELQVTCIAD